MTRYDIIHHRIAKRFAASSKKKTRSLTTNPPLRSHIASPLETVPASLSSLHQRIMTILSDVRSHASRILNWRLNEVVPTSREHKHMDAAGVSDNPIFRSFLAWRHTNLTLAFPITLFSAIWGLLTLPSFLADNDYMANFTLFGKILLAVPYYANTLLFLSVCVSAIWWNNWRRTRFLLKIGWAASFGVSFVPALFPLEYVLSSDTLTTLIDPSNNINFFLLKMRWAMKYLFVLLPLVVSFPSGAMRAAIRIRGLLPQ